MGKLFTEEVALFKSLARDVPAGTKTLLVEVGQGTAELFAKVEQDFDLLVGVEINGGMNDLAVTIHGNLKDNDKVKLIEGNGMELNKIIKEQELLKPFEG
jgi:16S rRNA A1518/A1519 N6-dimethyltransferase RsmA/KsgA/DIM1 with predicted DNA glycosylase/AP lyase activity